MNNLSWYINLYYKFRDYPITELSSAYKPTELKSLYNGILKKMFLLFQMDNRREGEIEGLISKNNYDLMVNKRAETNLAQEQPPLKSPHQHPIISSGLISETQSVRNIRKDTGLSLANGCRDQKGRDSSREGSARWVVQGSPSEQNMDVFYELMIKMIRVSLRRLMVEAFAIDKYGKSMSKDAISQIFKNRSEQTDGRKDEQNEESIEVVCFPTTAEELKFQFLSYCIKCKIYNNPTDPSVQEDNSVSSANSSRNMEDQSLPQLQSSIKPSAEEVGKVSSNQIEELIMKVSQMETTIFNRILDNYLDELKNSGNNEPAVTGVKHIAESLFEMAFGPGHTNPNTNRSGSKGSNYRRQLFQDDLQFQHTTNSLSSNNILLSTWFDLILFKETPNTLFEIIEELVRMQDKYGYLDNVDVSSASYNQAQNKMFYYKMASYHHLLILNSTKNILIQSLCKINYLLILFQDVLAEGPDSKRSFNQIKLKKYEEKIGHTTKVYPNIQLTCDLKAKTNIWKQEAMEMLLAKWKIIANVITEVCVKNGKAFFAAIFQKCVILLDRQLSIQVQLIEQLMTIAQTIANDNNCRPNEKALQTCRSLYLIIKEIIGYPQNIAQHNTNQSQDKLLNINNFINTKSEETRYKESTFANREENTEELSKWTQIINQNIYVYSQYTDNLKRITKLFNNNCIYTALWFNKFHNQIKSLMRKVDKDKLETIFNKFNIEVVVLWESMTTDQQKPKARNRFRRNDKAFRTRISSIKSEKCLNLLQKKAIVLNYMVKAELQLYSHYMLINYLNNQKSGSQFVNKQMGIKQQIAARPVIFDHGIIQSLLLFTVDDKDTDQIDFNEDQFQINLPHYNRNMTSNFMTHQISDQTIKTHRQIQNKQAKAKSQHMAKALNHFEKPMNIQLDLKDNWKDKFGEEQIQYLAELNDFLRYINEINYLYQLWTWVEAEGDKRAQDEKEKKIVMQLIDGKQYKHDLNEIDSIFQELNTNEALLNEFMMIKGDTGKILAQEHLSQMLKRIKMHNKQLYMMIEAIMEGQNYYKLLGLNLVGRNRNAKFKSILQEIITLYKDNKREKPTVRMIEKIKENLQYDPPVFQQNQNSKTVDESIKSFSMAAALLTTQSKKSCYITSKVSRKGGSFVSYFEFAPEYYKTQSKIFRLNCLIASFQIGNTIFKNIKHNHLLSKERLDRLSIIGSKYYDKLETLLALDKGEETNQFSVGEETLILTKNVFEKKMLLFMVALINLSYHFEEKTKRYICRGKPRSDEPDFANIPEQDLRDYCMVLKKYSELLKKFIYWKIKQNIKRMQERQNFERSNEQDNQHSHEKQFNICKFLQQILELSEKNLDFTEDIFLIQLQSTIEKQTNLKFSPMFKAAFQAECQALSIYKSQEQKVEYLRKKLSYLLMREMYFSLNYDNDFLEDKSTNSKRNYLIYEQRIFKFYDEIIRLDCQQYMEKKEEELKKRSIHLKNYQFKYEQQPAISSLEQRINQLICCLFNQLLISYTTSVQYKMFKHKHKQLSQDSKQQQLFQQYCASQYEKECMVLKQQDKLTKEKKNINKQQRKSISSIFNNLLFQRQKDNAEVIPSMQNVAKTEKNMVTVLVYTEQKFQLSQSIKIYLKIITDFGYSVNNSRSELQQKGSHNVFYSLRQEPLSSMELQIIKTNERSLITMLKSQFLQKINQAKCNLILKHLISNIQKLYINLDVRHKVFQSFKDRILNYEMQKAKIYHQYMDYIRGLKLDVYSHMAGEESLPYIKIIHAVKQYRLHIKKIQLQQRVNDEFQKNLQKWNVGIQKNLIAYDTWLSKEQASWVQKQQVYEDEKKKLFKIYHAVCKEMKRQSRPKKKMVFSAKSITNSQVKPIFFPPEQVRANIEKQSQALQKMSICKHKQMNLSRKTSQKSGNVCYRQANSLKISIADTNKANAKHQKLTWLSKSTSNLRGISLKYDITNFRKEKEKTEKTKNTDYKSMI